MSLSLANGIRLKVFIQGDLAEATVSGLERIMYGVYIEHYERKEPEWKGFELYDTEKWGRTVEEARKQAIRILDEGLAKEVLITEYIRGNEFPGRLIRLENGEAKETQVRGEWRPWRN